MRLFLAGAVLMIAVATAARACDQPIVLANWKSCAIGELGEEGGDGDWKAVPKWTRAAGISRFFYNDPRLLALHGLCNAKFKRVVLCPAGWQESEDKTACWYLICSGYAR